MAEQPCELLGQKKGILYRPYKRTEVIMLLANQGFKVIYDFEVGNAYYFRAQNRN